MASFIMAGRMQAAIFVALSTLVSLLLPPMAIFTNAAIALITLRQGWQQGIIFAILGSILLGIVSAAVNQGLGSGLLAGIISLLPIVAIASVLAISKSWDKTLQLVLIVGFTGILVFHLIYPDAEAYWKPLLEQFKPVFQQLYQISDSKIDEYISQAAKWATGTFASAYLIFGIISLMIARSWQALLYNPGGFGEEFRQIRIGKQAAVVFIAMVLFAIISTESIATELLMVGIVVFMFQGLSLAHSIVKQRNLNIAWLVVIYVLMFILLIQTIVLLATFGIIDNFADFRKKIRNNPQ